MADSKDQKDNLDLLLEESRIVIKPNGEVIIENLTEGLLEVALTLDPDHPGIACLIGASQNDKDDESSMD